MFRPNRAAEATQKPASKMNFFGKIFSTKRTSPSPTSHNENTTTNISEPRKKSPGFIQSERGNFDKKLYQEYCNYFTNKVKSAKRNLEKIGITKEKPIPKRYEEEKESFSQLDFNEEHNDNSTAIHRIPDSNVNLSTKFTKDIKTPLAYLIKNRDTGLFHPKPGDVFDIRKYTRAIDQNRARSGSPKTLNLIQEKAETNAQLISFIKLNKTDKALTLLDKKRGDNRADVNAKDFDDISVLSHAVLRNNIQLVNYLLFHHATIDALDRKSKTPFIFACEKGFDEIALSLLNAGAELNWSDYEGKTGLFYAIENDHLKLVKELLNRPSLDIKIKDKSGKLAFDYCKSYETRKLLADYLQKLKAKLGRQIKIKSTEPEIVNKMFSEPAKETPKMGIENKKTMVSNSENSQEEERIGPSSFHVHGLIGRGSFGEVYLVEKIISPNTFYAMKALHKSKIMSHNLIKYAMTERNVLSCLSHPFIVKLNYAFQTSDKLFLILDYCPGGDLGEHLQKEKRFTEERVRYFLAEILTALEHLHKRDIIFRDLKPDNIVLDSDGHAMLTDFGLSKEGVLNHNQGARSFCGSVAYLAPEMLKRCGHGKAVDWYLFGVVMYELLVGIPPYYANNKEEIFQNIEKAPLKLPSYLSPEVKSLLKGLLQRNPAKRLGSGRGDAEEIKSHPFFMGINWEDVLERKLNVENPKRKIKICKKNFGNNVFDPTSNIMEGENQHVSGWTFVNEST